MNTEEEVRGYEEVAGWDEDDEEEESEGLWWKETKSFQTKEILYLKKKLDIWEEKWETVSPCRPGRVHPTPLTYCRPISF